MFRAYFCAGLSPQGASKLGDASRVEQCLNGGGFIDRVRKMKVESGMPIVAIGPIGFDYTPSGLLQAQHKKKKKIVDNPSPFKDEFDNARREAQRHAVQLQLNAAQALRSPVILCVRPGTNNMHACEAAEHDVSEALAAMAKNISDGELPVPIVIVGFGGKPTFLASILRSYPTVYAAFSSAITFRSAGKVSRATDGTPVDSLLSAVFDTSMERLLLASDAPYARPRIDDDVCAAAFPGYSADRDDAGYALEISAWTQNRSSRRQNPPGLSRHLPIVAQKIAAEKRVSVDEVLATTCENALRIFGIETERCS